MALAEDGNDETTSSQNQEDGIGSNPWFALGLLCAAVFMDAVDVTIIQVTLPTLQQALGFTEIGLQWVHTIYVLMFGGFMLLGGRVADLYGRRRFFLGGVALFATGSLIAGLAPTQTLLLGGRGLQGLGAAITTPAALSIITNTFPAGPKRNRALGIFAAVGAGGFSLGLVFGGFITSYIGWRWIFFINLPVAAVVLALSTQFIPPSRSSDNGNFDIFGGVLITGGLLAGVYALTESVHLGWTAPRIVGTATISVVLLGGFIVHEHRTRNPLVPLDIFERRSVTTANFAAAALGATAVNILFFGTQYFQSIHDQTALWTGFAFLPMGILSVIVSTQLAGQLVNRYGLRPVLTVGMSLTAVGVGYLSLVPINGSYWISFFPGLAVMAVGYGLAYTSSTVGAVADISEARHGLASGLQQTSFQLGTGIGLAIYVTIAATFTAFGSSASANDAAAFVDGFNVAMAVAAVVAGVAALAALTLRSGLEAESTATETVRDGQETTSETTD